MESVTEKVLNQIDRSLQGQLSKVKRKYKRHMICFCVISNITGSVRDLDAIISECNAFLPNVSKSKRV